MTNCQSVLENADVPELLVAVVDVILHVTNTYPHVFGSHFKVGLILAHQNVIHLIFCNQVMIIEVKVPGFC